MEEISLKAELTDEEMRSIFGMRDAYIKKVESSMDVRVVSRIDIFTRIYSKFVLRRIVLKDIYFMLY